MLHLPIAGSSVLLNTCTVKAVDDGLLRISIGSKSPAFSLILYIGSLKAKLAAKMMLNSTVTSTAHSKFYNT